MTLLPQQIGIVPATAVIVLTIHMVVTIEIFTSMPSC